jgi:hypothetical protein
MVLFKPSLDIIIHDKNIDTKGRYIFLKATIQGHEDIHLINIYAPNDEENRAIFIKDINTLLSKHDSHQATVFLGGDFNTIIDPNLDRKGGKLNKSKQQTFVLNNLEELITTHDLCDIWRIRNPDTRRYTWRKNKPVIHSRLDFWLVTNFCQDFCTEADIIPSIRSDHSAVTLNIHNFNSIKGKGHWKFNNSYLDEIDYVKNITTSYSLWEKECKELTDKRSMWEYMKYKIREYSVEYGKQKAKHLKRSHQEYEQKLKELEERLDNEENENEHERLLKEKSELEAVLQEFDNYHTEGLILRSRCQWHEKGEKSNKYFLNLINRNKRKTTLNKILDNGKEVTDAKQILELQANFYENLYNNKINKDKEEIINYLKTIDVPKIDETCKDDCDGRVTLEECTKALKLMKMNKSPGNDGLTVEFYQKFWGLISNLLLQSFNESFENGQLSHSQRQAVITLLDKGKDRTLLKNWRPISLLNTDYKLLSKVIAERIKPVLTNIINPNQVGYVQGRNITDNIRIVSDILDYTKAENIPGILLSIDFKKAFDSVNWVFLKETLKKFNFGESFIRWVEIFYNNISSCVINNGVTSKYFQLHQGVRQGDPLSPYLFILIVEILASIIRKSDNIKGIDMNGQSFKVLQYADDTNGLLADIESARNFLETVKQFGTFSGLHLNSEKTQGMWLGKNRKNTSKPFHIDWPKGPLRILGVFMSYDEEACNNINFDSKIEKCKNILNMWKGRRLTMLGRTQIVKTFIVSQFLYVTSVIHIPEKYIQIINKLILDFIWKSKKHKLRHIVIVKDKALGGLNVPDFESMIKAAHIKWLRRIILNKESYCWRVFCGFLESSGVKDVTLFLQCNFNLALLPRIRAVPKFYIDALKTWSIHVTPNTPKESLVWYNRIILIGKKMIFIDEFYKSGITVIKDLFDNNNDIIPFGKWIEKGVSPNKWLDWISIIKAAKEAIDTHQLLLVDKSEQIYKIDEKDLSAVQPRDICNFVKKKVYGTELSVPRIAKYLPPMDISEWKITYENLYKCIECTRLQEFQYKFLNDILINNYWLYKWKLLESDKCKMCSCVSDTVDHRFWECQPVKTFWSDFKSYMASKYPIILTKHSIFLGVENDLLCTIIFEAKYFIQICSYKTQIP